jgi:hypothetical protein
VTFKIIGARSGAELDTDSNRAIYTRSPWQLPGLDKGAAYYTVTGGPAAIVAATLAANTSLALIRFDFGALRRAYLTRFQLFTSIATVGASALVGGKFGIQRFINATATSGGTQRLPSQMNASSAGSSMVDCRDNNSALTITNGVFRDVVGQDVMPVRSVDTNLGYEWTFKPQYPVVIQPGEGLALRTQVAMPATQTWVYSYIWQWREELI